MTPMASEATRARIKSIFTESFGDLPFSKTDRIKVLDVGCGLGFLSCVCAEFYTNARVTGIDIFEHPSLHGSSLVKARKNARTLGLSNKVRFLKADILHSDHRRGKFDLFVSNLVFHNFGKKRFEAYERLASWVPQNSYVLLGDLFFRHGADLKSLSTLFGNVKELPTTGMNECYKMLELSDPE